MDNRDNKVGSFQGLKRKHSGIDLEKKDDHEFKKMSQPSIVHVNSGLEGESSRRSEIEEGPGSNFDKKSEEYHSVTSLMKDNKSEPRQKSDDLQEEQEDKIGSEINMPNCVMSENSYSKNLSIEFQNQPRKSEDNLSEITNFQQKSQMHIQTLIDRENRLISTKHIERDREEQEDNLPHEENTLEREISQQISISSEHTKSALDTIDEKS